MVCCRFGEVDVAVAVLPVGPGAGPPLLLVVLTAVLTAALVALVPTTGASATDGSAVDGPAASAVAASVVSSISPIDLALLRGEIKSVVSLLRS